MLSLCLARPLEACREEVVRAIENGSAYAKMKEWITAQGGDVRVIDDPALLPTASILHEVKAPCDGYISHMDAELIGTSASLLGAGRIEKDDEIDSAAGIVLSKRTGDCVKAGETLAVLHTSSESLLADAEAKFLSAFTYSEAPVVLEPTIYDVL